MPGAWQGRRQRVLKEQARPDDQGTHDPLPRATGPPSPAPADLGPAAVAVAVALAVPALTLRVERVLTWPVNDQQALDGVLRLGVNGVISDDPHVLEAVVALGR